MRTKVVFGLCLLFTATLVAQEPYGKIPTQAQLRWHDDEFYLFIHFGPNTFTNLEWGHGDEAAGIFNPEKLDTRQWCRIAKQAGAAGIIITAKHHDGFCLWPSQYSTHTVRESKWRNGQGDVLKELSQACKEHKLKFGVYLSPWDRNHPQYGTPEYNQVYANTIAELFANYGPIWEFWWDGANGEGPNGKKQEYDWALFRETIKKLSPETVVFSDVGPHIRWVGNERGIVGETNWNTLNIMGFTAGAGAPSTEVLNTGNEDGEAWIPGECDVSIRPGWFYHKEEDTRVKQPAELFNLYLKSVGRGANFLLNVPPDRNGLFTAFDSSALVGFAKLRKEAFSKNLIKGKSFGTPEGASKLLTDGTAQTFVKLETGQSVEIRIKDAAVNCVELKEHIALGQRIKAFKVQLMDAKGVVVHELNATTIGHKRILTFPAVRASKLKITFTDTKAGALLSEVAIFKIDDSLVEK